MNENIKKYIFHVSGMHCKACELLVESEIKEFFGIRNVKADLKNHSVTVEGEFGDTPLDILMQKFNLLVQPHGYGLLKEKEIKKVSWSDYKIAFPIAGAFILLFIILQKLGIVNLIGSGNVTLGTAFVIGVVASLSTCMAVVGGLVLSMSANFAKDGDKVKPQLLFHVGRLVSFFVLGGVIGAIGSAFELGVTSTFVLSIIVGLVMLILGINLLDTFHWAKKLQPSMPKYISKHVIGIKKINHTLTPLLLGIATFFLPCGFTQSMQIFTLSTGNFWSGAMTMSAFALGTLPVLAVLSFSSLSIKSSKKSGIFLKTAGIIVIFFALFNLINAFVGVGVIPPLFNL